MDTCWRSIGGRYVDSSSLSEVDMADDRREWDCDVLCHLVCVGSFCYVLFLSGNNLLADADEYEVTVTVLDKRMEQHEKRRKVGKHRYVSDGMRYEYYLEVAFDNGTVKTLHVSRAVYRNAQKGQPKALSLSQGGLGLPVIKQGI